MPLRGIVIFISALLFVILGVAWVMGYDFVKKHAPKALLSFYFLLALLRVLLIATWTACYIFLMSQSGAESKSFVVMILIMYATMMAVSLMIRH